MPDVDRPHPIPQAQGPEDSVEELREILARWAALRGQAADPVPILTSLCEIVERETELYLKMDPDPFDDRHPYRINPNSSFGALLKALFQNDEFMDRLVNHYMSARDSSPKLNELACRLFYDMLPGLEGSIVFTETEGIVTKLYKWAEEAENPLKSYAIGLLGASMGVQDVAVNWREKNARLMPMLLDELHELANLPKELPPELQKFAIERPFASLNGLSDLKESTIESGQDTLRSNGSSTQNNCPSDDEIQTPNSRKRKKVSSPLPSAKRVAIPSRSPIRVAPLGELSNSSWAEKEFLTIGHYQIYPLSTNMRQRFILQYLYPLGEYQEFLPLLLEKNVLKLILHYINLKENRDVRLAFEALRYLSALLIHKKFTMEFLKADGVKKLLQVYRPSIAATGVSICLYYLGHSEDAMEKLCQLPSDVLTELIKYSLWLLERSHESSRCHAIMFLGTAFTYQRFLEYFDREDGLRWVMNVVSTLEILTCPDIYLPEVEMENNDKVFTCMQTARHVCYSLKKYFEAQLMVKTEQLRQSNSLRSDENVRTYPTKQLKWKQEEMEEALEFVLVNLPSKIKWPAVDNFVKLGGVHLMLKLLLIALDDVDHISGKTDLMRSAVEVLSVTTLVPKTQLALMESVEHPNPDIDPDTGERPQEIIGMSIILSCIENATPEGADMQKAALRIAYNCVGGPRRHEKAHQNNNNVASTSSGTGSTKKSAKSGDGDVLHRMWKCLRSHNGIMILLGRLSVKVPITEADSIRALACKALCGLARCSTVRQIISKLPLFTRGELEVLTHEPILYDSSAHHVRFCQYANTLTQLVTGNPLPRNGKSDLGRIRTRNEASLASVPTEIKYKPSDLLVLMYEHMLGAGLTESAQALLKEAKLQDVFSEKRNHWRRMAIREDPRKALTASTNSSQVWSLPITPQSKTIPLSRPRDLMASPVTVGRRQVKATAFIEKSDQRDVLSPVVRKNTYNSNILSLDGIVREYLSQQHSCCNVPVATCPPFELLAPHRCEEPILKSFAPKNLTSRILRSQSYFPFGGHHGAKQTRKYIYSKFKPVRTFREADVAGNYTCCAFSSCDEMLFVGTGGGELKVFNLVTGVEEANYSCHDTEVTHCQPSKQGTLILTSSFFRQPTSILWTFTELFTQKMTFQEDTYVEFGKLSDERILGTQYGTARLYDTTTGRKISTFFDQKLANQYLKNRATLNRTDELVLNDGVLWDVRRAQPVHKFDKFNPYFNGVFAANGLEMISNTEVWDLRTYKLLHTIPALNQCQVLFNSRGDVIYGAMVMCEDIDLERDEQLQSMYGSSFKTIDATDYSNIATIDIKRSILDIKTDKRDAYLAIVENTGERSNMGTEAIVRLYDIGRQKLEGESDNEQDDDGVEDDDDDDDDDDDADSNSSTELLDDSLDNDSSSGSSGSDSTAPPVLLEPLDGRNDGDDDDGDDGDDDSDDGDDDDDDGDDQDQHRSAASNYFQMYEIFDRDEGSDNDDDGSLFQVNSASGGGANSTRDDSAR